LPPPLLLLSFASRGFPSPLPSLALVCIDWWHPVQVFPQLALATAATTYFHSQMVTRLFPQVALLFLAPLLFASLATVLQLADESQDVVLPNLEALRVHELALVTSAITALQPHCGRQVEDVLRPCASKTLEVFWSRASPSVCLLLLLIFCPLSDPLEVIPFHLPRRVSPHLRHLFLHLRFAASEACFPALRCRFHL